MRFHIQLVCRVEQDDSGVLEPRAGKPLADSCSRLSPTPADHTHRLDCEEDHIDSGEGVMRSRFFPAVLLLLLLFSMAAAVKPALCDEGEWYTAVIDYLKGLVAQLQSEVNYLTAGIRSIAAQTVSGLKWLAATVWENPKK